MNQDATPATPATPNVLPVPSMGLFPTEAQIATYPHESAMVLLGINHAIQTDLNASVVRESDLRDALSTAVAAIAAIRDSRMTAHQISNILRTTLFFIKETTGITPEGSA